MNQDRSIQLKVHDLSANNQSPVKLNYHEFLMTTKNDTPTFDKNKKKNPERWKKCRKNLLPLFEACLKEDEQVEQNSTVNQEPSNKIQEDSVTHSNDDIHHRNAVTVTANDSDQRLLENTNQEFPANGRQLEETVDFNSLYFFF